MPAPAAKPLLLFLDQEGVLETPVKEDFIPMEHLERLEQTLLALEDVFVVLSTPRREESSLEDLVADFSTAFRGRIIGVLPCLAMGRAKGGRELEAKAWLQENLPGRPVDWLAVDDEPVLWTSAACVIDTNALRGFDETARGRLLEAIASRRQAASVDAQVQGPALSKLDAPPVGLRALQGRVTAWHPEVQTGFLRPQGRQSTLGFKGHCLRDGFSPRAGMPVEAWLSRDGGVLHVREA